MAFWGPNGNERFRFGGANGTPTVTLDDFYRAAGITRTDQIVVYLTYFKGTETGVTLRVDFADPASHLEAPTILFEDISLDPVTNEGAVVRYTFKVSGEYRIPVPMNNRERLMRVSIASAGGVWSGTGEIWFSVDNQRSPLDTVTVPVSVTP